MAFIAKDVLDKVDGIKSQTVTDFLQEKKQGIMRGAAIGAGVGLAVGYFRKYNLIFSAFVGALGGAVIVKLALPKKDTENS